MHQNKLVLLCLPDKIFARAKRERLGTIDEARRVQYALATSLLTAAPMRVHNLTALEQNRHIVEIGRGRARLKRIIIPGVETKTDALIDVPLAEHESRQLDVYLNLYRPVLCKGASRYLFPALDGGMRSVIGFSGGLSRFIKQQTGLDINAHLFRHIAAKLYLDENPGDIETVRRMLGHRSTETTLKYYAEHRNTEAFRAYDITINKLRNDPDRFTIGRRRSARGTQMEIS